MTHKDIYTKFMIEYDKAGASTSYPSLTEYEVATVLDKAYNALIAQKVTGNNVRRATFESDIKSIADLGPLVNTAVLSGVNDLSIAPNIYKYNIQNTVNNELFRDLDSFEFGGIIQAGDGINLAASTEALEEPVYTGRPGEPIPVEQIRWYAPRNIFVFWCNYDPTNCYEHHYDSDYDDFLLELNNSIYDGGDFYLKEAGSNSAIYHVADQTITVVNKTNLLYFLQGSMLYDAPKNVGTVNDPKYFTSFTIDSLKNITYNPIDSITLGRGVPVKLVNHEMAQKFFTSASNIPWIKEPVCFIEGNNLFVVYDPLNPPARPFRITYIKQPNTFVKDLTLFNSGTWTYFTPDSGATDEQESLYEFECNSTVAEELVSLAVAFALENVESLRLNSKLNMRGLEA